MKKIFILFASLNLNGNTGKLLKFYLNYLLNLLNEPIQIKIVNVYNLKILSCCGCKLCQNNKHCWQNQNDDFLKIINLIKKSDRFILASNVFFSGFPSKLKAVFDRCEQFFLNKPKNNSKIKKISADLILTGGNLQIFDLKNLIKCCNQFFCCLNVNFQFKIIAPQTDKKKFGFFLIK